MSTLRIVTKADGTKVEFITDLHFIEFAQEVYKANEIGEPSTIHWLPENIHNAVEYIHEWCADLTLQEIEVDWSNVIHYKPFADNTNVRCLSGDGNRTWTREPEFITCPFCLDENRNKEYWNQHQNKFRKFQSSF